MFDSSQTFVLLRRDFLACALSAVALDADFHVVSTYLKGGFAFVDVDVLKSRRACHGHARVR